MRYYGSNRRPSKDSLQHWKYIKREKVNGKWKYYYNVGELKSDIGIGAKKNYEAAKQKTASVEKEFTDSLRKDREYRRGTGIKRMAEDAINLNTRKRQEAYAKEWMPSEVDAATKRTVKAQQDYDYEKGRSKAHSLGVTIGVGDLGKAKKAEAEAKDAYEKSIAGKAAKAADRAKDWAEDRVDDAKGAAKKAGKAVGNAVSSAKKKISDEVDSITGASAKRAYERAKKQSQNEKTKAEDSLKDEYKQYQENKKNAWDNYMHERNMAAKGESTDTRVKQAKRQFKDIANVTNNKYAGYNNVEVNQYGSYNLSKHSENYLKNRYEKSLLAKYEKASAKISDVKKSASKTVDSGKEFVKDLFSGKKKKKKHN